MKFSAENITSLLSFFVGLLYLIQISFLSKSLSRGFIYLKLYLANLTFIVFFFSLSDFGFSSIAKYLIPLLVCSVLLIAPLMFFYISSLCSNNHIIKLRKHIFYPIVIGIILLLAIIVTYFSNNKDLKNLIMDLVTIITMGSVTVVFIIQNIIYLFWIYKLYNQHQNQIKEVFSYTENVDLKWVRILLYGYLVFIILFIIVNTSNSKIYDIAFDILMTGYIIYIGMNAIRQKEIYFLNNDLALTHDNLNQQNLVTVSEPEQIEDVKEQNNEQKKMLFETLKHQITIKMEQDKVYKDQDLTIYKLAKLLNTNSKYVSIVINTYFEKSFVNFINEYRINEAKEHLLQINYKNYTIEAHGNEVGFKSKSSFNLAFKKHAGVTPSEFVKNNS